MQVAAETKTQAENVIGQILGWELVDHTTSGLPGTAEPSIFQVLSSHYDRYNHGDADALNPSPQLDRALHQLVRLVTHQFEVPYRANRSTPNRATAFHHTTVAYIKERMAESEELRRRGQAIRLIANIAETQMEHWYAKEITGIRPDTSPHQPRIDQLASVLKPFPYFWNYVELSSGEIQALRRCQAGGACGNRTNPVVNSIAFCGAGPLPLSAILMHLWMTLPVELIEVDSTAAAIAATLLDHLANLEIVDRQAMTVTVADASTTKLNEHGAVLVASLIDLPTVNSIAAQPVKPAVLATRSASDLVELFCYECVPTAAIAASGWNHVGTVSPGQPPNASTTDVDDEPFHSYIDPSVLNTTDFYRPETYH